MRKDLPRIVVAIVALLSFVLSAPSLAAVYKCTGPDGKLTYSDQPCTANENSQQVTITPEPLHSAPPPGGASSVPSQNRQAEVQACTAKAFSEWQQAMGSNMPSPHVQIDKVRQFRNQCIRQLNQSASAAVQQSSPSTPSTTDPVADRRARELKANQCYMTAYNTWIHGQGHPLPDIDVLIAKQAEIKHACREPLGLRDLPSPPHGPESVAFHCGLKQYHQWLNEQTPPLPNGAILLAKQTEFIDDCRRPLGLPLIGHYPTPAAANPTPVAQPSPSPNPDAPLAQKLCIGKAFHEWVKANQPLPDANVRIAKINEIRDECARAPVTPISIDHDSTAAPKAITVNGSTVAVPSASMPAAVGVPNNANKNDPLGILDALADRIYVIGETTGKGPDMIAAEVSAADEVRKYLATGATDGLLAKDKSQQSPLEGAAYMGYPNVVAALLTSNIVKAHINDADDKGMTPWIAAMFSLRQTVWSCNPTVWDDPFRFVPTLVSQPYYLMNPTPPYAKTRDLLEKAGATIDMAKAKDVWVSFCKSQTPEGIAKVKASTDLQKTFQELGARELAAKMVAMQKKAAQGQKN